MVGWPDEVGRWDVGMGGRLSAGVAVRPEHRRGRPRLPHSAQTRSPDHLTIRPSDHLLSSTMPVAAITAEWNCTRCGVTNRKLVPEDTTRTNDRCVTCRTRHTVEPSDRPVRWTARIR